MRGDLLIAAPGPPASFDLQFDSLASTEIEVAGGEVGNTILSPGGGVTFRVVPQPSRVRHPVWWDEEPHTFFELRIEMPRASGETTFSIAATR